MAEQRRCWKCGEVVPKSHYCEACGADLWNPPQGSQAFGSRVAQHVGRQDVQPMRSSRQSSTIATAGIVIIATLMAFTFWFWFGIGIAATFNPPERTFSVFDDPIEGSYLDTGRVWFGVGASFVMTALTWWVGMTIADAEE